MERAEARKAIVEAGDRHRPKRLRKAAKHVDRRVDDGQCSTFASLARLSIGERSRAVAEAASADLSEPADLHSLRIAVKRLRYAVEVFASCMAPEAVERVYPQLIEAQEFLGAANDARDLAAWLEDVAAEVGDELSSDDRAALFDIERECAAAHRRGHADAVEAWRSFPFERMLADFASCVGAEPRRAGPDGDVRDAHAASGPTDGFHLPTRLSPYPRALPGPQRLAAIDVGSNSIRLVIAEAEPDGSYRMLDDEREVVRLGQGLDAERRLSEESMERAIITLASMRAIADGYGVCAIRAVGTSAVRDAVNQRQFVDLVKRRAGVDLEVISGEDEARLAHLSVAHRFDLSGGPAAVVDIGGGSTEIILSTDGLIDHIHTLPLGAVRLTGKFGGPERCATTFYRDMRRHIDETIHESVSSLPATAPLVIGTGGTFTALAHLDLHRATRPYVPGLPMPSVQGHELHRSSVRHMLDLLRKTPIRARMRMPGLPADRADIIVAGVAIIDRVMKHLGANRLRIHDRGVRDGLLLTMIRELFPATPAPAAPRDPLAGVRRFARACRYEETHAEHVRGLAMAIHDDLAQQRTDLQLDAEGRFLLEAAAILHDVGYMVNYARHHKHSYHLIVHSDLEGMTSRQREIIANVARYHRRGEPSKKHEAFARLSQADRALVRRLSAILRVADGLDRTHTQTVRSVDLRVSPHAATFVLTASAPVETDVWGARRKGGLLQKVLGVELVFTVHPQAEETTTAADVPTAERG